MGERWLVATTEYAGLTPYTGGIGRHYAALLPALVRCGVQVDLAVYADGPAHGEGGLDGVRVVSYRTSTAPTAPLPALRSALHLRSLVARGRYDRIFLPEWAGLGALLPRHAPVLTNLATSLRLATEVSELRPSDLPLRTRLRGALQVRREERQTRRSAGLIAISRAMRDRVVATSAARGLPPIEVVHNCVEVERIAQLAGTAELPAGWPTSGDPVVLFLGRAERRKGVVDAVEAFGILHRTQPSARLVLAGASGDRRYEPDLRQLIADLPGAARDRVTWLDHVPGGELYRAIREADVALCPSRWEGFGNVALEVKAVGTPLVVTSGSGFDDFCRDGHDCLMVPPAAPEQLAEAVRRLLEDRGLAAALRRGGLEGVAGFAPDPIAADLVAASARLP